ncbi:MAG TPA: peptidylprolyl isomerase [Steroidobacteraceae bacterium]|nr:peptidylprolyl isomerase [Steroidobacteraceae bacterium]
MIRPIWATLASVALLLAGAAQAADSAAFPGLPVTKAPERVKSGELLDRAVAVVNDGIVTESDLQEQIAAITERLTEQKTPLPPPDVLRKQVLDRLVIQEIQLQRAEKVGLKITDEQLNEQLADIAKRNNITLAQLPAALAQQGIEYAGFRDNMRKEMTLQRLRQRDVLSKINVTPRELEQFLERMKKLPSETDEYNVSHILLAVPPEATQAQVKEVEKLAEDVYNRSKNEDFGRLAVAYSNSQTALEGGALGWRKGPELPTVLAEIVVGLKPGDVSRPLFTNTGYHLVKLNGIRSTEGSHIKDQVHARHILMRPNELQDDATVRQRLADIRERVMKGEEFAAFASTMSVDSSSAVNGGDLGWSGPGSFVPEFDATLARLKENEISEPFHTEFGWHIVQLLGRRQFDTTEESQRQRAFRQLRESKADEETEMWLRRLRDEAFVETDL